MTGDLAVNVEECFRVATVSEVDLGQDALVTITFEFIQAPQVLIEGVPGEQEAVAAFALPSILMAG